VPTTPGLTRFEKAVRYVMINEDGKNWDHDTGCFTNDPRDPGGATMWGVIKTEYETFLGRTLSIDEVKAMPRETAVAIYKKSFWDQIHGDEYSTDSAAIAIMDVAVNKGLGGCMVCLSDALNQSFPTRYGIDLVSAVNLSPNFIPLFEQAVQHYIDARIAKFPNMRWAAGGWRNRAQRLLELK